VPLNISAGCRLVVVELIGPVVDDGGAVTRTIADILTRAGLDLLPGAQDRIAGMAPAHALRTLAEGHGRFELVDDLAGLEARCLPALSAWAGTGHARLVSNAIEGWQRLADAGFARAMLTALPAEVATPLAERVGLVVAPEEWIVAGDSRGIPHPDRISAHLAGRNAAGSSAALVQSIGAALAVAAAGCREVVAVGAGGATMLADRTIAAIGEYADVRG
jgi:phosphoglycolate phosphatase-like HAD superfamily hydrolase